MHELLSSAECESMARRFETGDVSEAEAVAFFELHGWVAKTPANGYDYPFGKMVTPLLGFRQWLRTKRRLAIAHAKGTPTFCKVCSGTWPCKKHPESTEYS